MWQFTIWWRWSAVLASNSNNIILANKKGCSLRCFLLSKSPRLCGHMHSAKKKAPVYLNNRRLCRWVSKRLLLNQKTFQLRNNHCDSLQLDLNQFFRFGVGFISRKHSFQRNFGITAAVGNASKTDALKVSCCLHGLLHLHGKISMHCDCKD